MLSQEKRLAGHSPAEFLIGDFWLGLGKCGADHLSSEGPIVLGDPGQSPPPPASLCVLELEAKSEAGVTSSLNPGATTKDLPARCSQLTEASHSLCILKCAAALQRPRSPLAGPRSPGDWAWEVLAQSSHPSAALSSHLFWLFEAG